MATENTLSAQQIAAQLYTVREFTKTETDIVETMKKVRGLGYEAVQCSRTRSDFARCSEKHR